MSAYVNEIAIAAISVREILPVAVKMLDLPDLGTNILASAHRLHEHAEPVDITSVCTIADNSVVVSDVWLPSETERQGGSYIIRLLAENAAGTTRVEANLVLFIHS